VEVEEVEEGAYEEEEGREGAYGLAEAGAEREGWLGAVALLCMLCVLEGEGAALSLPRACRMRLTNCAFLWDVRLS
jgi:hypothetical protein